MNNNQDNHNKKEYKPSKLDKAIELVIKDQPEASKSQIANKIVDLGITNHIQSVYNRLKKSDYLKAEIGQIRDNNRQFLDRVIVPDALKVMRKAIKSKDLDEKGKLPYVKLAVDKSFGELHHVEQPQVIHIDAINNAQFNIASDLKP